MPRPVYRQGNMTGGGVGPRAGMDAALKRNTCLPLLHRHRAGGHISNKPFHTV